VSLQSRLAALEAIEKRLSLSKTVPGMEGWVMLQDAMRTLEAKLTGPDLGAAAQEVLTRLEAGRTTESDRALLASLAGGAESHAQMLDCFICLCSFYPPPELGDQPKSNREGA
jgi:hypothetical protein